MTNEKTFNDTTHPSANLDDIEITKPSKEFAAGFNDDEEENSPFEVIRATVSNKDDPTLPTLTFRALFIGTMFTAILAFVNQFFWFRTHPLTIGILVVQLLTYPIGRFFAAVLPKAQINLGIVKFSLNPGPFSIKEHVLITAIANAAGGTAYAIDIITIKKIMYQRDIGKFGSFLLVLTTQCVGYGLAGVCRRFLVRPAAMIWPATLVNVTLFRTLHEEEDTGKGGMSRMKFFVIVAICSFFYYFLPGFAASFLSTISILCYVAPDSKLWNQIGSGSRGLGVLSFSLDWNTFVAFLGSPLVTPFWAEVNVFIGFIGVTWILVPIGYYSNIWDAKLFPVLDSGLYKADGSEYVTNDVIDKVTLDLDEAKYNEYGELRMSYFFAISYGTGFATLTAVITHTLLYHGKEIIARFREARSQDDDIHCKLMDRYDEAPDWWYGSVFFINMIAAIFVCEYEPYGIRLPWWGVIMAIAMAGFFLLPIGIITAIANQTPGLNIITEFVIGYILPGRPIANVTFKTYGYIAMYQAIVFVSDLKLGHYMKIPPKEMFLAQLWGTLVAGVMNVQTAYLMYDLVDNICTPLAPKEWRCSSANVFYSASVIWGVIGPAKMFGPGSTYNALMWWFLIGALAPIPFWLLARRYPDSFWKYVHTPVILGGTAIMPPAQPVMYPSWFIVGFIFQFYLYRYRHAWWSKFNYVFSAAMDSGVAISGIVIFFAFTYNGISLKWWGNGDDCPNLESL